MYHKNLAFMFIDQVLFPTNFQGVIFGMHFSRSLMRLCSVSDDRSIRLWQLASPEESNHSNNSLSLAQWESMEYSLTHELYGHGARVWDAKLLSGCIVSVGEVGTKGNFKS